MYAGESGRARGIIFRDQAHQTASGGVFFYQMIQDHDLEVTTFTAWKAPEDADAVLYTLAESLFMVAFGTLREKDTSLSALRNRFMASDSFGIIDTDPAFEPANDKISINDVSSKFDSFDDYLFRERQRQVDMRGDIRTEQQ
jgi:hypothetical protein